MTDIAEKISALFNQYGDKVDLGFPNGRLCSFLSGQEHAGWLNIEEKGDFWRVMYTTHEHHNLPVKAKAYAIDVMKADSTLKIGPADQIGVWANSTPVTDENLAAEGHDVMINLINKAYNKTF